jgi:hypothetical protein
MAISIKLSDRVFFVWDSIGPYIGWVWWAKVHEAAHLCLPCSPGLSVFTSRGEVLGLHPPLGQHRPAFAGSS